MQRYSFLALCRNKLDEMSKNNDERYSFHDLVYQPILQQK